MSAFLFFSCHLFVHEPFLFVFVDRGLHVLTELFRVAGLELVRLRHRLLHIRKVDQYADHVTLLTIVAFIIISIHDVVFSVLN